MTDPTPPLDEYLSVLPDRVVTRVNELMTTALDFAVAVLFAIGAWFWGARYLGPGMSWCAAALTLFVFSLLAQWRSRPRRPPVAEPAPVEDLPGASHPGNVHILGR